MLKYLFLHVTIPQDEHQRMEMDKSAELLTFQEALDNVAESEEQLIDEHKAIILEDQELLEEEKQLLHYVENVDRDIDGGCLCVSTACCVIIVLPLCVCVCHRIREKYRENCHAKSGTIFQVQR